MKERILVVEHEEAFPSSAACPDREKPMSAYIEIVAAVARWRLELDYFDLRIIGEFTRVNIASWLDKSYRFELGVYGYEDFHAVGGDIDIPWATEEARLCWTAKLPFQL